MRKLKELFFLLTIGNIGLHHVQKGQWEKSLVLLITFICCVFSLMGNLFMIQFFDYKNDSVPFAETLLHPDSAFTIIFLIAFSINRLVWAYEITKLIFGSSKNRLA